MGYNYDQNTWATYESDIQGYRSNFLSSQSLLVAAGAVMYDKSLIVFATIAVIALIQMWYVWFRVIISRTRIADFHKYELYKSYDAKGNPLCDDNKRLEEKVYASDRGIRNKVNDHKKLKNFRITRIKLDVVLPISLTFIWAAFIVVLVINRFN